jgi:hypothetical protein
MIDRRKCLLHSDGVGVCTAGMIDDVTRWRRDTHRHIQIHITIIDKTFAATEESIFFILDFHMLPIRPFST